MTKMEKIPFCHVNLPISVLFLFYMATTHQKILTLHSFCLKNWFELAAEVRNEYDRAFEITNF